MSATSQKGQYFYSAGKRKTSVARCKLFENGNGEVVVNDMPIEKYFAGVQIENALAALRLTDNIKTYDVAVTVSGGGKASQSDAMRLGISRALLVVNPELRSTLKPAGFLRRDARVKERKKPGLKRARRAPQFSKR